MAYIRLLVLLSIAALAGCDPISDLPEDTSCSLVPDPDQIVYLPLEAGDEWVFDYEYEDRNHSLPSTKRMVGTLTWTVKSVGPCERERQLYTLRETLEGTTRYYAVDVLVGEEPFQRSKTITLEAFGDSAYVPYVDEPIARFGPSSGPDTLTYYGFDPLCVGSCIRGISIWRTYLDVVAGSGVVSRSYFGPYSAGGTNTERIVRRSGAEEPDS